MALEEYKRKRDFKITAEPPGKVKKSGKKLSFVIQKHDATRLHYDFRLEFGGVLWSWAVTRGPSFNPKDKRLAVRTEDHPLAYGEFEGIIPEGEYGGGTVMLWDQGEWIPEVDAAEGIKKGSLKFTLKGKRLQGKWALVRMHTPDKRENWLLIKEKDDYANTRKKAETFLDEWAYSVTSGRKMEEIAEAKEVWSSKKGKKEISKVKAKSKTGAADVKKLIKKYPAVQLATLVDQPPQGKNWIHEVKFDGYRLLGFVSGGHVVLKTRNGLDWTEKFPAIAESLSRIEATDAVIDMEAVITDEKGRTSFQSLQRAFREDETGRIIAYAFDLLHFDGKDLTGLGLLERKEKLATLLKKSKNTSAVLYSEHISGDGEKMLENSCQMDLEGIISKDAGSKYSTGRQRNWVKSKCTKRQEFIITGMMAARSGGRDLGALYLGYYKGKKLAYAGKVGTGFTMKSAEDIANKLKKIKSSKSVFTREEMEDLPAQEYKKIFWVKPHLLCEIEFTEWTDSEHIRHPSFQGLREDKGAKKVIHEEPEKIDKIVPKGNATKKKHDSGKLVLEGVEITHPERVIDEASGVTKGDLARYYAAIAPYMLKSIAGRPLSLLRCPAGLKDQCFFQRNPGKGLGDHVETFHFRYKGKKYEYLYINDAKGLMEIVQMGSIEIHPWGADIKDIDHPDWMVFDLDPDTSVPFEAVKLAALDLRARLKKFKLESFLKTTGGKGLHVVVPLSGKNDWEEVKTFAENLADQMVEDTPDAYVATMTKSKRTGKIFIDFFRNDYTATSVADYGVRAREGAPVALPVEWSELKKLKAASQFSMDDVLKRIKKNKPDMARYKKKQSLPK